MYYITIDITIDIQSQFLIPRYLNSDYINVASDTIVSIIYWYHYHIYHLIDITIDKTNPSIIS